MLSAEVGGEVRRKRALNCWPWVRSLTHSPEAVIHSPAEIVSRGQSRSRHHDARTPLHAEHKSHSLRCGR